MIPTSVAHAALSFSCASDDYDHRPMRASAPAPATAFLRAFLLAMQAPISGSWWPFRAFFSDSNKEKDLHRVTDLRPIHISSEVIPTPPDATTQKTFFLKRNT